MKIPSFFARHPALVVALAAAVLLSLPGINWGRVECWNLDQMAHNRLRPDYLPKDYLKPPLHSYLHEFIVIAPVNQVISGWFRFPRETQYPFRLVGSRLLTVALYAAGVALLYFAVLRSFGAAAAGCSALLYATSAGILVFNRFLTVDSTLLFWMLASFGFSMAAARSGKLRDAAMAGLFAGLAAAAKYNGVLVAVALPVAIVILRGPGAMFGKLVWTGAGASIAGFAIGNPGLLLDTKRFFNDFWYNTATTPVYDGIVEGHGYWKFLAAFPEILGWPGSILLAVMLCVSAVALLSRRFDRSALAVFVAALVVALLYFALIGRFQRLPVRFALPVVPFLLIACAPAFAIAAAVPLCWMRRALATAFGLILAYNIYSAWDAGMRFAGDGRHPAIEWMRANAFEGAVIESIYSPNWTRALPFKITQRNLPTATGRHEIFGRIFSGDSKIEENLKRFEPPVQRGLFTPEALGGRAPDFLTFSTQVFEWTGDEEVQKFFSALDEGRVPGWRKAFESTTRARSPLAYPVGIDFLTPRMIVIRPEQAAPEER